jgi:hypothetical protein
MLEQALADRDEARQRAHSGPTHERICALRKAIVDGKHAGLDTSKLETERGKLVLERDGELAAHDAAIHDARQKLRAVAKAQRAAELEGETDAALERKRHEVSAYIRAAASELEAIAAEIGRRARAKRLAEQLERMSPEDRTAFLAMLKSDAGEG